MRTIVQFGATAALLAACTSVRVRTGEDVADARRPRGTTHRTIVTLSRDIGEQDIALQKILRGVGRPGGVIEEITPGHLLPSDAAAPVQVFRKFGVAVITVPHVYELIASLAESADIVIKGVEREELTPVSSLFGAAPLAAAESSWWLDSTGVTECGFNGEGARIGIVDTGVAAHEDFSDWSDTSDTTPPSRLVSIDLVVGGNTGDPIGHGTRMAGIAAGWAKGASTPYGVAPHARIYSANVFGEDGYARDTHVIAGILWAVVEKKCHVVCLSLGKTRPASPAFEQVAQVAVESGCVLVAAAGNGGSRDGEAQFTTRPANCRSILAVGAVDESGRPPSWTARARWPTGPGKIDLAAPGVSLTTARPPLHTVQNGTILYDEWAQGTSVAAAFVSGVAALYVQKFKAENPGVEPTGPYLWTALRSNAEPPLNHRPERMGKGIVRAP